MIKLPDNWESMIQLRYWLVPVNELTEIAIFCLYLQNEDGQHWGYMLPVRVRFGLEVDKNKILQESYKEFVAKVKRSAPKVKLVYDHADDTLQTKSDKPITNQNWHNLSLFGLQPYAKS